MAESLEARLSPKQRRAFQMAQRAARRVIRRRLRVLHLVRGAYAKLFKHEDAMARVGEDLRVLLRLSRQWAKREYRAVPWKSLVLTVAAVLYFVSPVDLIPDALAGLGFVDDVAVIGAVVNALRGDLERFLAWEKNRMLEE